MYRTYRIILAMTILAGCGDLGDGAKFAHGNKPAALAEKSGDADQQSQTIETEGQKTLEAGESVAIESKTDIEFICETAARETVVSQLFYPAVSGCSFDNGTGEPNHLLAFAKSTNTVSVPEGAVICDFALKASSENFSYDDSLVITLEDRVIVAKDKSMLDYFTQENELYVWDFAKIKGLNRGFDSELAVPFFLGGDCPECVLPPSQSEGVLSFAFAKGAFSSLSFALYKLEQINLGVITTGDNDKTDCSHSDLKLEVQMTVVRRSVAK